MSPTKLAGLVRQNVRRSLRTLLAASLGIVIGIGAFTFFLSLREGVREKVLNAIFPIDRLEIVPHVIIVKREGDKEERFEDMKIDLEALKKGILPRSITEKQNVQKRVIAIDDAVIAKLRAHADVLDVIPKMRVEVPVKAVLDIALLKLFGVDAFPLDLPVEGLPPEAVADEAWAKDFTDLPEDPVERQAALMKPVPIAMSQFAIEMYDGTFAPVLGLPSFTRLIDKLGGLPTVIELLNIEVVIGDGVIRQPLPPPHHVMRAQMVGLTDKAMKLGVAVPMSYAKLWNSRLGPQAAQRYSSAIVVAKSKSRVGTIASFVRTDLDLIIDDSDAEKYAFILDVVSALLIVVAFIIMATAAINIGHVFFLLVAERRREIGILRALGASQKDITAMILFEAATLGLFGGLVGVGVSLGTAGLTNWVASAYLPDFPFKPDSFFVFQGWIIGGGLAFAVVFCVLGAWLPARRAAKLDPAAALAKG